MKFTSERTDLEAQMNENDSQSPCGDSDNLCTEFFESDIQSNNSDGVVDDNDQNNNAQKETELDDSGSENDVVINTRKVKTKEKSKTREISEKSEPRPGTSRQAAVDEAHKENESFEQFMVWMDKYKQFQAWEASRNQGQESSSAEEARRAASKSKQKGKEGSKRKRPSTSDSDIEDEED